MKRTLNFFIFSLSHILCILLLNGCTQNNTQIGTDESRMISAEEAQEYALNHAGVTENQVTFIKSNQDRDDARLKYDVEFYTNDGVEYDYEIDPYTGNVLSVDFDVVD